MYHNLGVGMGALICSVLGLVGWSLGLAYKGWLEGLVLLDGHQKPVIYRYSHIGELKPFKLSFLLSNNKCFHDNKSSTFSLML